jgi:hypothetical protein
MHSDLTGKDWVYFKAPFHMKEVRNTIKSWLEQFLSSTEFELSTCQVWCMPCNTMAFSKIDIILDYLMMLVLKNHQSY